MLRVQVQTWVDRLVITFESAASASTHTYTHTHTHTHTPFRLLTQQSEILCPCHRLFIGTDYFNKAHTQCWIYFQSVLSSVYPSISLFLVWYLIVCLSVCLSIYPSTYLSLHQSIQLPLYHFLSCLFILLVLITCSRNQPYT
jgi:hypothetical protein